MSTRLAPFAAAAAAVLLSTACATARADVPPLCDIEGGRFCQPCPSGGCPPGLATIPYVCCEIVSGESYCYSVASASECEQGILGQCDWGATNEDGSVTCYD